MDLKNKEWGEFHITEIFPEIQRGKRLKKDDHLKGTIPYVSSTALNNGIDGFIGNSDGVRTFERCLTLANSGSVGIAFYQPFKIVASDHVTKLKNPKFNKYVYLFLATVIKRLSEKYSFNREINDSRIRKEIILLPIDEEGNPDYIFMENYIKRKEESLLSKYVEYKELNINNIKNGGGSLNKKIEWKEFFIEETGTILSGTDIYETERIRGGTPYITATANNNGIGYFVGNKNATLEKDFLSVNRNGSVGYSFYHTYLSLISNDCRKIRLNVNNKYTGLFVANQISAQKDKYGYGYKMGTGRLKRQKIMLPIKANETPDYEYMENYMKHLEYQKLKKYLTYKESRNN